MSMQIADCVIWAVVARFSLLHFSLWMMKRSHERCVRFGGIVKVFCVLQLLKLHHSPSSKVNAGSLHSNELFQAFNDKKSKLIMKWTEIRFVKWTQQNDLFPPNLVVVAHGFFQFRLLSEKFLAISFRLKKHWNVEIELVNWLFSCSKPVGNISTPARIGNFSAIGSKHKSK